MWLVFDVVMSSMLESKTSSPQLSEDDGWSVVVEDERRHSAAV